MPARDCARFEIPPRDANGFVVFLDRWCGWARALKKIVRKGDMKLRVSALLSYQVENLKPKQLVAIYSFSYYMQSTPERIANYAELIRRIETNSQVPKDIEIAKIFGFDSVADFEKDWEEFVKSTDFK